MLSITLQNAQGQTLAEACGESAVSLSVDHVYDAGDRLVMKTDTPYVYASVDAFVYPAWLYIPEGTFTFPFPTEPEALVPYSAVAFRGQLHTYTLAPAEQAKSVRRDLALNPVCPHDFSGAYPFVSANIETRNESTFFARNVVDGLHLNNSHGVWPYQSWGIGLSETAEITVDFGRTVTVDAVRITLRADFPHDAYWKQATMTLSDGCELTFPLEMTADAQEIRLDHPHRITSLKLHRLVKQVMDSPFPALRCLEVLGIG